MQTTNALLSALYLCDAIEGARRYLPDTSVDLIITDPPYGIDGGNLHTHYRRNETFALEGYIDVPAEEYEAFSFAWIREAERVLKPGGAIYIVSGYTNLRHILNALAETSLQEINHLIWKYSFGVYTKTKYVSSHYHILYYAKPGAKRTFNAFARFADYEKDAAGGSLNYLDREDVWNIPREYKPGKIKNKNELPQALLIKMMQYSSVEGDLVCDFFLGGFSTAKTAIGLGRRITGFEKSVIAYECQMKQMKSIVPGALLKTLRTPPKNARVNAGKAVKKEERERIVKRYRALRKKGTTKKSALEALSNETGRGYWSLLRIVNDADVLPND